MRAWVAAALIACAVLPAARAQQSAARVQPPAPAPAVEAAPAQVLVLMKVAPPHFRPDGAYASGYADAAGRSARRRAAAALARSHGLRLATDWPMPALGLDCYVMDVPPPLRPEDVAGAMAGEPQVAWVQAMNVFRPLGHDDPLFGLQPAARAWHLDDLHRSVAGREVRIAVIDSALQSDHPDLAGQVVVDLDFVGPRAAGGEQHGTAVAGILAARADNRLGIAGVAPQARLLALRACRQASPTETLCSSLSLARALSGAIERDAQIINLSLGGPSDRLVGSLIEVALARGAVVVAATDRSAPDGGFPASLPGVLAAVDEARPSAGSRAVVAPGTDVPTTVPGSRWATVSGASYAAAHLSGLLALMLEARSRSVPSAGTPHRAVGADLVADADGRIDACASLVRAGLRCACDCAPPGADESVARH